MASGIAVLLAVVGYARFHHGDFMTDTSANPLPPMSTRCFARHLIDLPTEMELQGDVELYYGLDKNFSTIKVELLRSGGSVPSFEQLVAEQVLKLTEQERTWTPSKNLLAARTKIDDNTTLLRAHKGHASYTGIAIAKIGDAVGLFSADIYEGDNPEVIEAKVLDLVRRTSYAPDPEKAGKGTCLGPLLIDGTHDGEVYTLWARSGLQPDLRMEIDSTSVLAKSDGGLLRRHEKNFNDKFLNDHFEFGKPIRKGKVDIAGRPGEELVTESTERDKVTRSFMAEGLLLKPSTPAEPRLSVGLDLGGQVPNGGYVDASLSKAESLALWDTIVKSVRVRPGAL